MVRNIAADHIEVHRSSQPRTISRAKLETLQDLLEAIRNGDTDGSHLVKMLGATAAHVVMYLGRPPGRINIRTLMEARPGLKVQLKESGFKRNSIRAYCYYIGVLIQKARELGWAECAPELATAWKEIRDVVATGSGCIRIIEYALAKGKSPQEFAESDLNDWTHAAVVQGTYMSTSE